jgi:hypothetical protein
MNVEQLFQRLRQKYIGIYKFSRFKWYKFEDHHWHQVTPERVFNVIISDNLVKQITEIIKKNPRKFWMGKFSLMLNDPKFEKKLNKKQNLIGFNNGVYDLNRSTFRAGKARDYISFTTGYDYVPYNEKDPKVLEIRKFLSELFPVKEECGNLVRLISNFLKFRPLQQLHILKGGYSSGKSSLIHLIEKSFGDYCRRSNYTHIGTNLPNPDMVNCYNRKIVIGYSLPPPINFIKGKNLYRNYYESNYYKVRTNFFMLDDNDNDNIEPNEMIKVIKMRVQFVTTDESNQNQAEIQSNQNKAKTQSNQYQIKNRYIKDEIEKWGPTFMAILLDNLNHKKLAFDLQEEIKQMANHFTYRSPEIENNRIITTGGYRYHESLINFFLSQNNSIDDSIRTKMIENSYLSIKK